jgi:hypothetical protein
MTLTPDQSRLLASGHPVPLTVEQTPCVLVRKDVFERLRSVQFDDGDWTEEETAILAARTFAALDRPEAIQ